MLFNDATSISDCQLDSRFRSPAQAGFSEPNSFRCAPEAWTPGRGDSRMKEFLERELLIDLMFGLELL
jgi:hypothetical protein